MMLGLSKNKSVFGKVTTKISKGTRINGFIESTGILQIDGTLKGGISKAKGVVIGDTATVEGNIYSEDVRLSGKVEGDICSGSMLELMHASVLIGNIETIRLSISEGAHFNGTCNMIEKIGENIINK